MGGHSHPHRALCQPPALSQRPVLRLGPIPRSPTSLPKVVGTIEEVAMFEMINEHTAGPADRKVFLYKVGMFIVALAAVGGILFFCVQSLK